MQKLQRLPIRQTAGCRCDHARNHTRIQPVAIQRDQHVGACRNGVNCPLDTVRRDLARGHECDARPARILVVAHSRAANSAHPDLDDAVDPIHLARAAHGRGQAQVYALNLIPPVGVRVDLQNRELPPPGERLEQRDRHGIVAAKHHRNSATTE